MWFMNDVEADGPIPADFSMVSLGAVAIDFDKQPSQWATFYGRFRPVSDKWDPKALAVSGHTREECLRFPEAGAEIRRYADWVTKTAGHSRPMFISDNNGFDWQFPNWYFHHFLGFNPYGFSSSNLGSLYKGIKRSMFESFKHLRVTKHDHHPVNDALGNAEAFVTMVRDMRLKVRKDS